MPVIQPVPSEIADAVAAGPFGPWLEQFRASLRGSGGTDVPCGDCTGCCTSGYSIQLRPDDRNALARIPPEQLVSAPGFPRGHMTLPALPDGLCPMLHSGKCSIYRDRPQTCLDYDCRIFAAAGIDAGGTDKAAINRRVRQWRFSYSSEADRLVHSAVLAAATFIQKKRASFVSGRVPTAPTGIAVLAIKAHAVFLAADIEAKSDVEIATAILDAGREFDAGLAP
jgi:Fe-S-cluster containining protein